VRPLLPRILAGERLVGDGAMATMLFQRGLEPGQPVQRVGLVCGGHEDRVGLGHILDRVGDGRAGGQNRVLHDRGLLPTTAP